MPFACFAPLRCNPAEVSSSDCNGTCSFCQKASDAFDSDGRPKKLSHLATIFCYASSEKIPLLINYPSKPPAAHENCFSLFCCSPAEAEDISCGCANCVAIKFHWREFCNVAADCYSHPATQLGLAGAAGASSFFGAAALCNPANPGAALTPLTTAFGVAGWLCSSMIKYESSRQATAAPGGNCLRFWIYAFALLSGIGSGALSYAGMGRLAANVPFQVGMSVANGISTAATGLYSMVKVIELINSFRDAEQKLRWSRIWLMMMVTALAAYCTFGRIYSVFTVTASFIKNWLPASNEVRQAIAYAFGGVLNLPVWALLIVSMMNLLDRAFSYLKDKACQCNIYTLSTELVLGGLALLGGLDYAGLERVALVGLMPAIENSWIDYVGTVLAGVPRAVTSLYHLHGVFEHHIAPCVPASCTISQQPKLTKMTAATIDPQSPSINQPDFITEQPTRRDSQETLRPH